jgi:hypothetical protein
VANDLSHNIVILRGTVTAEEAAYDLTGWGDKFKAYQTTELAA